MDDIHVYLPDGKRVVIAESYVGSFVASHCVYLQVRKWYGWSTLIYREIPHIDVTEMEAKLDGIICEVIDAHERQVSRYHAKKAANARLQAIFHGKVRDVKCPKN
ncbi:hypothetical protein [Brevibacillus porteri]|uniref:hypothetical protein n=1 Tax=Brevibacillus porteri TaxID=2126350 RepID=UPI003D1BCD6F